MACRRGARIQRTIHRPHAGMAGRWDGGVSNAANGCARAGRALSAAFRRQTLRHRRVCFDAESYSRANQTGSWLPSLHAVQGIKGVSANRCNKMLGCKSTFWMDESYDHIVRDAKELAVFRNYIVGNPAKAGLKADEYSLQLWNVLMPD